MKREILISATPQETRVAILEDDVLVELMVDRPDTERIVGDIYLGRVEAVLPGIQAAFVDIGTEKAAFLHVSDVARRRRGLEEEAGEDDDDEGGRSAAARDAPYRPSRTWSKRGALLVQVSKEPISTKGPRVTTHISLPGRFLVYMPGSRPHGRQPEDRDREERSRLRSLAKEVVP